MRLGTDIVEIERIAAAVERNAQFPTKILSEKELVLFRDMKEQRQYEFLAGRFSVKEAYANLPDTTAGPIVIDGVCQWFVMPACDVYVAGD